MENIGKNKTSMIEDFTKWKITSKVPDIINKMSTYAISNNLEEGLTFINDSIEINGIDDTGASEKLVDVQDYKLEQTGNKIDISFIKDIGEYKSIEIYYTTRFNDKVVFGGNGNNNYVELKYTNKIEEDYTQLDTYITTKNSAEVHTGKVLILKTDGTNPLSGAKFKIAKTEQDAKNENYIKDDNNVFLEAMSDNNGFIYFSGLSYGQDGEKAETAQSSYWIVETQAPSYKENEEIKYYKLQSNPIEIKVTNASQNQNNQTRTVINKKEFTMPITGGIGLAILAIGVVAIIISSIKIIKGRKNEK